MCFFDETQWNTIENENQKNVKISRGLGSPVITP